jgi:hypothetical protein
MAPVNLTSLQRLVHPLAHPDPSDIATKTLRNIEFAEGTRLLNRPGI